MANAVIMPKMGLTMTEGLVARWLKKEGEQVQEGQPLFEVETDKLTNEINSNFTGTLLKILVQEGESVPCITTIAYIGEPGEEIPQEQGTQALEENSSRNLEANVQSADAPATKEAWGDTSYIPASPAAKQMAREKGISLRNVFGTGQDGSVLMRDVEHYAQASAPKVSGLAKNIARELGIDITGIAAENRVMSADVLRAALAAERRPDIEEPLNNMRRTISRRMTESWQISPHVCYNADVDCTNIIRMRSILKRDAEAAGLKLTYNHIIMLAVTKALLKYPAINASLKGDTLIMHTQINLGLAVGIENGLVVPNLKDCGAKSLLQIAEGTEAMIERARTGRASIDEFAGGTFTITNLGMYGIKSFSPIINQPELAILGISAMIDLPVVREGNIVSRPVMECSLVADHRVIDGVMAASFLNEIIDMLTNPIRMLL